MQPSFCGVAAGMFMCVLCFSLLRLFASWYVIILWCADLVFAVGVCGLCASVGVYMVH